MKKYLYATLVVFCFNLSITAEEVTMESDGTIMEFNYITVTDPQNFMMALDKFDKSKCADKWRTESDVGVSLWSLRGSGSSHFILVVYENAEKMEMGRAIFNSCNESAAMIKSFQKILILIDHGTGLLKMLLQQVNGPQIQFLLSIISKLKKAMKVII